MLDSPIFAGSSSFLSDLLQNLIRLFVPISSHAAAWGPEIRCASLTQGERIKFFDKHNNSVRPDGAIGTIAS